MCYQAGSELAVMGHEKWRSEIQEMDQQVTGYLQSRWGEKRAKQRSFQLCSTQTIKEAGAYTIPNNQYFFLLIYFNRKIVDSVSINTHFMFSHYK